ncbi:MAG TPA: DUF6455 family protein [Candidatus Competibacteraceae bacterium]|nr:DUF6455 family protein [Candidatus Competibacteraceae bacterium]
MNLFDRWMEKTDRRMTLMQRMMERLEVDSTRMVCANMGMTLRNVVGRCRGCATANVCARWLDGQETGSEPGRFCPNAETFASHRQQ